MQTPNYRRILSYAGTGILAAVVINVVLFYLFTATGIISSELIIPNANRPLGVDMVIFATAVPLVFATLLYMVLARFTRRAYPIFLVLALTFLLFSFSGPFSIPDVPTAMAIGMNILHVTPAAAILIALRRTQGLSLAPKAH
jgi:hypothetical protein